MKNGGSFHSHVKLPEGSWYTNPYHGLAEKACNSCSFTVRSSRFWRASWSRSHESRHIIQFFAQKKLKPHNPMIWCMSKNVDKKLQYTKMWYFCIAPNCLSPSFEFGKAVVRPAPWLGESPSNGSITFPLKPPWQKWMGPRVEFAWTVGWFISGLTILWSMVDITIVYFSIL